MSYEVIGESIKSAISIKLGELFNNPIRYKESITNQQYPNFRIIQVNTSVTPLQTKIQGALNKDLERVRIEYLMNIQYREASDTELVTNLLQKLDAVGFKLLTEFKSIDLGFPVYTTNRNYQVVDGILQFFCNIAVNATNEQVDEIEMVDLELQEELEEEEE